MKSVDKIIKDSMNGISGLDARILSIDGMSSAWVRHLLSNLIQGTYLEIGVWHGSTFISALYGKSLKAYAIDNFSQYNEDDSKTKFIENCALFGVKDFNFIEQDAFKVDLTEIKNIEYYFYDGDHIQESSFKALTYYYPVFSDKFMLIVDDYGWLDVKTGIKQGIKKCKLKIKNFWELKSEKANDIDTWWNGLGIFILEK